MMQRINVSKRDVKYSQLMTWIMSLFMIVGIGSTLFNSFTLNVLYMMILILVITSVINYFGAKMWNIWYENDFLVIQNMYGTKKVEIINFQKIEMNSAFNNSYVLHLINGDKYQFQIRPVDDLKLFFKLDPQFYAKQMTQQLEEIKLKKFPL